MNSTLQCYEFNYLRNNETIYITEEILTTIKKTKIVYFEKAFSSNMCKCIYEIHNMMFCRKSWECSIRIVLSVTLRIETYFQYGPLENIEVAYCLVQKSNQGWRVLFYASVYHFNTFLPCLLANQSV